MYPLNPLGEQRRNRVDTPVTAEDKNQRSADRYHQSAPEQDVLHLGQNFQFPVGQKIPQHQDNGRYNFSLQRRDRELYPSMLAIPYATVGIAIT